MQTISSSEDGSAVSPMEFTSQLRALLGERGLLNGPADLQPFSTDWRGLFKGSPLCVALPRSAQEVGAVIRACAAAGYAVVPSGGNTGLSGGATPDTSGRQVVLSLSRMTAIRRIDVYGETIEVEAGCILQTAQEAAAAQGLLLPVTLASQGSARIGGIVSTNAGGTNVLRYGMARNRIRLVPGRPIRLCGRHARRVAHQPPGAQGKRRHQQHRQPGEEMVTPTA